MEHQNKEDIRKEQRDIMAAALDSMRKQIFLTDVLITCKNKQFAAHRVILSAGSPYFRAMFSNEMLEANSGKVEFEHVSPDSMQVVLDFLYTGNITDVENDIEKAKDILCAAHLLQVKLVYDDCWKVLRDALSIAQCFELWELAELYQHTNMTKYIINYIVEHFILVMASNEFLALPADKIEILLNHPLIDIPSDELAQKLIEWAQHPGKQERKEELMRLLEYVDFDSLSTEFISVVIEDDFIKSSSPLLCKLLTVARSRGTNNSHSEVRRVNSLSSLNVMLIFIEPNFMYTLNLKTREWQPLKLLTFHLERGMTSVFDSYNVYFLGGGDFSTNATTNVFIYNLVTKSCAKLHSFHYNRFLPGAAKLGSKLYVVGGSNMNLNALRDVEVYNIADGDWTSVASTKHTYRQPKVVTVDDTIFVVGCSGESEIEMYSEVTNQWSCVALMPEGIAWPLRVARHKQIIWVVDCVKEKAHRYNVKKKMWLAMSVEGTGWISEIFSAVETVNQGPIFIALDHSGVLYSLNPDIMEAAYLAENKELKRPGFAKWVHLR